MKCDVERTRRINGQKDMIEAALSRCQMTVSELAFELGLSDDTILKRINEMRREGRWVRIAGWRDRKTTYARIWGIGFERDEPKPVRVAVSAIRKHRKAESAHHRALAPETGTAPVRFRREEMDEWLFRAKGCNGYF